MSASRARILSAAAELYEREGYQGATTRRIAKAAGVNEVTLFRLFGSKDALVRAVLERAASVAVPPLPPPAGDPYIELGTWGSALLTAMRARRPLERAGSGELAGEGRSAASSGITDAMTVLTAYLTRLRDAEGPGDGAPVAAAAAMYVAALQYRASSTGADTRTDRTVCVDYSAVVLRALGIRMAQPRRAVARAAPPAYVPDATGA